MKYLLIGLFISAAVQADSGSVKPSPTRWEQELASAKQTWEDCNGAKPYDFRGQTPAETGIETHKRIIKEMDQKKEKVK